MSPIRSLLVLSVLGASLPGCVHSGIQQASRINDGRETDVAQVREASSV
jgi:hypothetical protein